MSSAPFGNDFGVGLSDDWADTYTCHPEARFWPKDLPEYIVLNCCFPAFSQGSWPESQSGAVELGASREILRPTPGLRMTDVVEGLA